jgi:hypothetical protein
MHGISVFRSLKEARHQGYHVEEPIYEHPFGRTGYKLSIQTANGIAFALYKGTEQA